MAATTKILGGKYASFLWLWTGMAAMLNLFGIAYASLEVERLFNAKTGKPEWPADQFFLIISFSWVIATFFYSHK